MKKQKVTSCACCHHCMRRDVKVPVEWDIITKYWAGDVDYPRGGVQIEVTPEGAFQYVTKIICSKTKKEILNGGYPLPEWCPLPDY